MPFFASTVEVGGGKIWPRSVFIISVQKRRNIIDMCIKMSVNLLSLTSLGGWMRSY